MTEWPETAIATSLVVIAPFSIASRIESAIAVVGGLIGGRLDDLIGSKRAIILTIGGNLVALIAAGYFWQRTGNASTESEAELQTVRVRRETLDRTVLATGVIRPMVGAEIDVGSRVSGIVPS